MAKLKVKKQDTFIDMTAMSDVTVLLLTFFMLTSTFLNKEPIQVVTPSSVAEFKVPDTNMMTILVDPNGKIFFTLTNQGDMEQTLVAVGEDYGITFSRKQVDIFKKFSSFGVPIRTMAHFLDLPSDAQDELMKDLSNPFVGIPAVDGELRDNRGTLISSDNELKRWVSHAKKINPDIQIAIKADRGTEYPVIKTVVDNLRDLRENRYLLLTVLKTASSE